jgi:uncharacterized protein YjiS (DUF1127 family)
MSTASNTIQQGGSLADSFVRGTRRVLTRWCTASIKWRLQQSAVSQLQSMSDRGLKDVGISRVQIDFAVRGEAGRYALSRFYC